MFSRRRRRRRRRNLALSSILEKRAGRKKGRGKKEAFLAKVTDARTYIRRIKKAVKSIFVFDFFVTQVFQFYVKSCVSPRVLFSPIRNLFAKEPQTRRRWLLREKTRKKMARSYSFPFFFGPRRNMKFCQAVREVPLS